MRPRPERSSASTLVLLAMVVALMGAGCAAPVAGTPGPIEGVTTSLVDPSSVRGTDGGLIDRLAVTAISDVQEYWRQQFEPTFKRPWKDLAGGLYSIDTNDRAAAPPPCVAQASEVEGNAFYCVTADAVAWDRAALLPVLRDRFGEAGLALVLAHELGHAVHSRAGIGLEEQSAQPQRFPTILIETMADCYAGAFLRWVTDGKAPHLRVGVGQLDTVLQTVITFRDPVGTAETDEAAHGNAFDRVSAFQDGYQGGPPVCAGFTVENREFTQRAFTDVVDRVRGGNLPFEDMLGSIIPNLDAFFTGVVSERGRTLRPPQPKAADGAVCPGADGGAQGPMAFCADGTIAIAADKSKPVHSEIGDFATGTLLATRYGLAALAALGRPVTGQEAGRQALCLAGMYTASVLRRRDPGFGLSPGDLDESVQLLLRYDYGSRDTKGVGLPTGFDRVSVFRAGALQGARACGIG